MMKSKTKKSVTILICLAVGAGALVGFSVYFVVGTVYYGIPSWWFLPSTNFLSGVPLTQMMSDTIIPNNPTVLSQHETITVLSDYNHSAIAGATVTIIYDGSPTLTFQTNASGQGNFVYLGEPTIIRVDMAGYNSINDVLPHSPEPWVQERTTAQISAAISGISSAGTVASVFVAVKSLKAKTVKKTSVKHRKVSKRKNTRE